MDGLKGGFIDINERFVEELYKSVKIGEIIRCDSLDCIFFLKSFSIKIIIVRKSELNILFYLFNVSPIIINFRLLYDRFSILARIIKFIDYCIRERKLYSAKWIEILKSYSHKTFIIWGKLRTNNWQHFNYKRIRKDVIINNTYNMKECCKY